MLASTPRCEALALNPHLPRYFANIRNATTTRFGRYLTDGDDPFGFHRLTYSRDVEESKKLNDLRGPCVIISASGMCEGGRFLHHLRKNIEDPRDTVLITGFQAEYTLGRKIVERRPEVPIFGEPMRLRAEVCSLEELSGHADQKELIGCVAKGLKKVFLVHAELAQAAALAQAIQKISGIETNSPSEAIASYCGKLRV